MNQIFLKSVVDRKKLSKINKNNFLQLLTLTSTMLRLYSQATICPYKQPNCTADEALTLDPEIEQIMAHSVDYDELAYVWNEWRDKSGKLMRNDYKKYVQIMNAAARANGNLNFLIKIFNNFLRISFYEKNLRMQVNGGNQNTKMKTL